MRGPRRGKRRLPPPSALFFLRTMNDPIFNAVQARDSVRLKQTLFVYTMSAPSSSNSLTGAAILAAHGGSVAVLRELLENPSAKALLTTLEAPPALLTDKLMPYVNGGSAGQSYCLLRQVWSGPATTR